MTLVLELEHTPESPGGDENTEQHGPTRRVSDSIGVEWGLRNVFLTNSWVMLMLLVQRPSLRMCTRIMHPCLWRVSSITLGTLNSNSSSLSLISCVKDKEPFSPSQRLINFYLVP